MYFFDFLKTVFKRSNIGVLAWLLINAVTVTVLIGSMIGSQTELSEAACFGIGFAVYLISEAVSMSPIGEYLLRRMQGCRRMDPATAQRIEPLFAEVCARARTKTRFLPKDVRLFISDEEEPNAFATGRKTVCVTKGLLNLSDHEICGVLAHEVGHLIHKDTDLILIVAVGNFLVTAVLFIYRTIFNLIHALASIRGDLHDSLGGLICSFLLKVFVNLLFSAVMWVWTKIGILLCMYSSRRNEYMADAFAKKLGFGETLASALEKTADGNGVKGGLWAALRASHPPVRQRIQKLRSL